MKKVFIFAATAVVAGAIVAGCGSSKQTSSARGAVEIKLNACEEYALMSPATRAFGKGSHFEESAAREIAELEARAEFARKIATATTSAATTDRTSMTLYSGDTKSGDKVSDQATKISTFAEGIAKQMVSNTVIVKMTKFMLPNDQFEVWVCLEYKEGVAALAQNIANSMKQRISDDDKMKMNFEFDQYRKRVEAELAKRQQ